MASKMSFRQHILLLLFLDIMMFMLLVGSSGTTSTIGDNEDIGRSSFLVDFILDPILNTTSGIWLIVISIFVALTAVGVTTSGSNFSSVTGVIASAVGVGALALKAGIVFMVLADYLLIYNLMLGGQAVGMLNIIGLIIFLPLTIDGIFAAIDWTRGVST